jgi:16S rRNA C1402 N4-methylase RsmH
VLPAGAEPRLKLVGRKSRAVAKEVDSNPRARSALLRVAQKIK